MGDVSCAASRCFGVRVALDPSRRDLDDRRPQLAGLAGWVAVFTNNGSAGTPEAELRYHWNGERWDWGSGLMVEPNVWTFAAPRCQVEPDKATIYKAVNGTIESAVNTATHAPMVVTSPRDSVATSRDGRIGNYIGLLDEVAVYDRAHRRGSGGHRGEFDQRDPGSSGHPQPLRAARGLRVDLDFGHPAVVHVLVRTLRLRAGERPRPIAAQHR